MNLESSAGPYRKRCEVLLDKAPPGLLLTSFRKCRQDDRFDIRQAVIFFITVFNTFSAKPGRWRSSVSCGCPFAGRAFDCCRADPPLITALVLCYCNWQVRTAR